MSNGKEVTTYRLTPRVYPKRIELELTDEIVEKISAIAKKTGRSFSEVVTDILSKENS